MDAADTDHVISEQTAKPPESVPKFGALPHARAFRLLKLYTVDVPSLDLPEGFGPLLIFSSHIFDLDDHPPYVALSYTWGPAIRDDTIDQDAAGPRQSDNQSLEILTGRAHFPKESLSGDASLNMQLDGRTYRITQNLQLAMKQLYRSGYGQQYVWIDAICIDQENVEEKTVQVAMMDEIYSKADRVVIWLGPDSGDFAEFKWLHEQFLPALHVFFTDQDSGYDYLRNVNPLDPAFTRRLGLDPPGGSWRACWGKFFDLCRRRSWFSRAWIVQEVALAKDAVLLCGQDEIPWMHVEIFGRLMAQLGWAAHVGKDVGTGFGRAAGDETARLWMLKNQLEEELESADAGDEQTKRLRWFEYLQRILLECRPFLASDPRDKVFAFLGMAKKALPNGMKIPIEPDYSPSSTAQSVFTGTASALLGELPRLSNLSQVETCMAGRLEGLPSWVPDYTVNLFGGPLTHIREESSAFDCCPPEVLPEFDCLISQNILQLRGAEFDTVDKVASSMWDMIRTQDILDCFGICENLDPQYTEDHGGIGQILWRTLVADTFKMNVAPAHMATSFCDWAIARFARSMSPKIVQQDEDGQWVLGHIDENAIRQKLALLNHLRSSDSDTSPIPSVEQVVAKCNLSYRFSLTNFIAANSNLAEQEELLSEEDQMMQIEGKSTDFHVALGPVMPFRRLFKTAKGYLGLGPETAVVGDSIWMMQGARVPFVLRRQPGEMWSLVGETYVHGFMNGEMAREVKHLVDTVKLI